MKKKPVQNSSSDTNGNDTKNGKPEANTRRTSERLKARTSQTDQESRPKNDIEQSQMIMQEMCEEEEIDFEVSFNMLYEIEGEEHYEIDSLSFAREVPDDNECSLTIVPVEIYNPVNGKRKTCNCLLDCGANGNALCKTIAKELGLTGKTGRYRVKGAGGKINVHEAFKTQVYVKGLSKDCKREQHSVHLWCYDKPLGELEAYDWKELKKDFPHLKNLNIPGLKGSGKVDMVIGTRNMELVCGRQVVEGGPGEPVAQLTLLGWAIGGNTGKSKKKKTNCIKLMDGIVEQLERPTVGSQMDTLTTRHNEPTPEKNTDSAKERIIEKDQRTVVKEEPVSDVEIPLQNQEGQPLGGGTMCPKPEGETSH